MKRTLNVYAQEQAGATFYYLSYQDAVNLRLVVEYQEPEEGKIYGPLSNGEISYLREFYNFDIKQVPNNKKIINVYDGKFIDLKDAYLLHLVDDIIYIKGNLPQYRLSDDQYEYLQQAFCVNNINSDMKKSLI